MHEIWLLFSVNFMIDRPYFCILQIITKQTPTFCSQSIFIETRKNKVDYKQNYKDVGIVGFFFSGMVRSRGEAF